MTSILNSQPEAGKGCSGREETIADLESAMHSLGRSLRQSRLHEYLIDKARAKVDVAGVALLYTMHEHDSAVRLTDLAEQLHIDAPAVTRKVQQLERSGLVGRGPDQMDKRAIQLRLTATGRRTITRILAARRSWMTTVLSDWSTTEQVEFARLVRKFTRDVNAHLETIDG